MVLVGNIETILTEARIPSEIDYAAPSHHRGHRRKNPEYRTSQVEVGRQVVFVQQYEITNRCSNMRGPTVLLCWYQVRHVFGDLTRVSSTTTRPCRKTASLS